LKPVFNAPPGMSQSAHSDLERTSVLRFTDKSGEGTTIRQVEDAQERFEPLPDGGFRVTSTLLKQLLTRDGQQITPPVTTVGLSLVFRVNAQGQFVALENADEIIGTLRERAIDSAQRKLLDATLTPELLEAIPKAGWYERHEPYCGRTFSPGDVRYTVANFELPLPARAPVRAFVKHQVLGETTFGVTPVMEVHLTFVGGDSKLARSDEAQKFLETLPPGERALTATLEGEGRRLISLSTCEVIEDNFDLDGSIKLPPGDASIPKAVLPTSVQFKVRQQLGRFSANAGQNL
jgi:hypothetical protein